jgi:hypothetical protein
MDCPDKLRRVTLGLDDDPDVIHGTVEQADNPRERFWGRLDLMSALERGTRASPHQEPPRPQSPEER